MTIEELQEKGKNAAEEVSNIVNYSVGSGMNSFLEQMSKEHRTTQQSFTRMCLMWLEQVAERKGPQFVDDRNKDSQRIAELLMNEYVRLIANSRRISEEEVLKNWDVWKPSKALRNV